MKRILLSLLILSIVAACAEETPSTVPLQQTDTAEPGPTAVPPSDAQLIRADVDRVAEPDVSPGQVDELVRGNNRFAFDLYHAVAAENDDNLIYSPHSIALAFSMTYAGARGETETQMAEVLHYLSQDAQHPAFNALDQRLAGLAEGSGPGETGGEPFQLNIANSVWGQQGYPFREAYLETLARQYGAGLRVTDFAGDADGAVERINRWVADETQERIKELVSPALITPDTRLVLANAIYFKATWLYQFQDSNTQDGFFALLDGGQVSVPLMKQFGARVLYAEGENYQAVRLPYSGEGVDMVVLLPAEGQFEAIEGQLSADLLAGLWEGSELHDVALTMPRFEFETELDLAQTLQAMGLTRPFGSGADFSGIVEGGGLYISAAVHKANITVDEKGTEAAAATAVVMVESAFPTAEVTLDRPFIYAIVARDTGAILFLGRLMNPVE